MYQQHLIEQLLRDQWSFLKLSASFFSIAVVAMLVDLITILFAGSISQAHLDGVGLADTLFSLMMISTSNGYSTVFDTYGPQVYGSTERNEIGTVLVKCLLQGSLINIIMLGPFLNSVYLIDVMPGSLTESSASPDEYREIAVQYIRLIAVVGFLDYAIAMISNYFAIQGHSKHVYIISVIMIACHVLANYVFISTLNMNVIGLGLASIIGRIIPLMISIAICTVKIRSKEFIWTGFSLNVLLGWGPMMMLGVSGAVDCVAELALFELSSFFSQFDGTTTFSVVIIIVQLLNVCYAFGEGVSRAGANMIGSALGDGSVKAVKRYMVLTILNSLAESTLLAITCFPLGNNFVKLFNPGQEVIDLFDGNLWLVCISIAAYHFQYGLTQGILVAFGNQRFIAWSKSIACYCVGLPVVIVTIFFMDLRVIGVISGCIVSDLINITAALYKISKIDIEKEIEIAKVRTKAESFQDTGYALIKGIENMMLNSEDNEPSSPNDGWTLTNFDEEDDTDDEKRSVLESNSVNYLNHEMKNVLASFLISTIICILLAGISFFKK
ncbi:hypothetical protein ACHWQZ_G009427 [Mnemiopsis leidyi]